MSKLFIEVLHNILMMIKIIALTIILFGVTGFLEKQYKHSINSPKKFL